MDHITSLLKIAPLQSQFIFSSLSFSLSPSLMLLFFLFSVPPSGGKWVTGRRLVSSFISWQPVCSSLCYWGWAAEAVGPRAWDRAPGCLSVCHGSCHMTMELVGQAENSEWSVFMGKCRTAPIGHTRGLKSTGKAGGRHCARRIYHNGWGAAEEKSLGLMRE